MHTYACNLRYKGRRAERTIRKGWEVGNRCEHDDDARGFWD